MDGSLSPQFAYKGSKLQPSERPNLYREPDVDLNTSHEPEEC